jgi:oxygen-independent coproporphyrinogen-3 oxidase
MSKASEPVGVYIHIPFCRSICPFCNFATAPRQQESEEAYLRALKREIVGARPQGNEEPIRVDSIYFGGGTPSVLSSDDIREIVEAVRWRFQVAADSEISLELDPGTADGEKLAGFLAAGVNRLSVGGQSLNDDVLHKIGRQHDAEDTIQTFRDARSVGFTNVNLDLMVGLPGEDLERDLTGLDELRPEHASVYILELASEVPMAKEERRGNLALPSDERTLESYCRARDALSSLELEHYEISNYARPGFQSRHNLKYWTDQPYLGFGASAHSYFGGARFWNVRSPARYVENMNRSGSATETREPFDPTRRAAEHLFTGLRRAQGVSLREVERRYGVSVMDRYGERLRPFVDLGLVQVSDGVLQLTERGFLVSSDVFEVFL